MSRATRISLGLAVLCARQLPGQRFTLDAIAAATGLTHPGVMHIERNALRKLRQTARRIIRETF